MKYGCIGEHLPHSFSKEIHAEIASYAYDLKELTPEELPAFMAAKDFQGINVTIPYKQAVIPFLDHIDETAEAIGAVNTVVNRAGRLWGYNTDPPDPENRSGPFRPQSPDSRNRRHVEDRRLCR